MSETIETKRLILRPWCDGDAADLYQIAKDPEVLPMNDQTPHKDVAYSLSVIKMIYSEPGIYAIVERESNKPIGCIGLTPCDSQDTDDFNKPLKERELGYWLGRNYWHHGYMYEAATALLDEGFTKLMLDRVWAQTWLRNKPSIKLLDKLGFRYQYLDNYQTGDGKTEREYVACLQAEDWSH